VSASKIVVSENIEIPVVEGRMQCIICKGWKLPGEMHSNNRTCQDCYEAIKVHNKNKPKPKKNNNSKIIKRNVMGWIERKEKPGQRVGDAELAKMLIQERAADKVATPETITCDGFRVSETTNKPDDTDHRPLDEKPDRIDGFRVSETNNRSNNSDSPKPTTEKGFRVSETDYDPIDSANGSSEKRSACVDGFRVSETDLKRRIDDLEKHCEAQAELLAKALQRIAILENSPPVIEKEDAKKDSEGMEKLRNDLYGILKERYEKRKINGIYVKSLYGPNGRIGGMLGVSKATAWRLREACRLDKRFRVEKADNQKGNWAIRLNLYMN